MGSKLVSDDGEALINCSLWLNLPSKGALEVVSSLVVASGSFGSSSLRLGLHSSTLALNQSHDFFDKKSSLCTVWNLKRGTCSYFFVCFTIMLYYHYYYFTQTATLKHVKKNCVKSLNQHRSPAAYSQNMPQKQRHRNSQSQHRFKICRQSYKLFYAWKV